jgi:hypothetical protein
MLQGLNVGEGGLWNQDNTINGQQYSSTQAIKRIDHTFKTVARCLSFARIACFNPSCKFFVRLAGASGAEVDEDGRAKAVEAHEHTGARIVGLIAYLSMIDEETARDMLWREMLRR